MANKHNILLFVSLSVFFQGSFAVRQCESQCSNQCRLDRLNALEPDNVIESEAGRIESWNPNRDQFQCAGVAIVRRTIEPNGLFLPTYTNAPQLVYVIRGRGMIGQLIPGCAETFHESEEFGSRGRGTRQDQHQKIHHFRQGDVIALHAGVAHWCYNYGNEPVVVVSVIDTSNSANQLDSNPRNFYVGGNPKDEFEKFQSRAGEGRYSHKRGSESCNNIFCGMDVRLISEAFNIDEQLASKLQGRNDNRGSIVRVEGGLQVVRPQGIYQQGGQCDGSPEKCPSGRSNGVEETSLCTIRITENIANPSEADVYIPNVGRVSTVNSNNLPVLRWLQLSVSHVVLRSNAVRLPHWTINSHSIIYGVRGNARIQVVNENGNNVFDGNLREGQVLTVPQNYVVMKGAGSNGFEYIVFKTTDNAMTADLAGRTSAIRGMPLEVLANAFGVSLEEADRIKYGTKETSLTMGRSQSGRRASA